MSEVVRVRSLAEAALYVEAQGTDPELGVWSTVGGELLWEGEGRSWRFSGAGPVEGDPLGAGLSEVLDAADLFDGGVRRLLSAVPDPTHLRPGMIAAVLQNLREADACFAQAQRLLEAGRIPVDDDGSPLVRLEQVVDGRARVAKLMGPLAEALRQSPRSLSPVDLPLAPGACALPEPERALLPAPPCPVDVMQSFFDRGWTLVDDAVEQHPGEAVLRHPGGAMLWIGGDDDVVKTVTLHEGRAAQRDEVELRFRPGPPARRQVVRLFARGADTTGALKALLASVAEIRHLGTADAADGRALAFFEIIEQRPYDRRWVLGVVSDRAGEVQGRYVLQGEVAWDQLQLLDALASPEGARVRARALAQAMGAALADALRAFVEPGADFRALTDEFRPHPGDAGRVFLGEAARRVEVATLADWADDPPRIEPGPGQREVHVDVATGGMLAEGLDVAAFPGGWRAAGGHLRPECVWATFVFTAPGQASGLRYDGLVCVGDRWVWFPKAWRLLRELA